MRLRHGSVVYGPAVWASLWCCLACAVLALLVPIVAGLAEALEWSCVEQRQVALVGRDVVADGSGYDQPGIRAHLTQRL